MTSTRSHATDLASDLAHQVADHARDLGTRIEEHLPGSLPGAKQRPRWRTPALVLLGLVGALAAAAVLRRRVGL